MRIAVNLLSRRTQKLLILARVLAGNGYDEHELDYLLSRMEAEGIMFPVFHVKHPRANSRGRNAFRNS